MTPEEFIFLFGNHADIIGQLVSATLGGLGGKAFIAALLN